MKMRTLLTSGLLACLLTASALAYTPPQTATAPITLSGANVIACPTCATSSGGTVNLGTSVTATSPRITGDATSGLYTSGAGIVGIANNGVNTLITDGNNRVAIGTTTPNTPTTGGGLTTIFSDSSVYSATAPQNTANFILNNTNTTAGNVGGSIYLRGNGAGSTVSSCAISEVTTATTTGSLLFNCRTAGTFADVLSLSSNKVGIGTATPSNTLTVFGTDNFGVVDVVNTTTSGFVSTGYRSTDIAHGAAGDWAVGVNPSGFVGNFVIRDLSGGGNALLFSNTTVTGTFGGGIVSGGTKFTTTGCSVSSTTGGAVAGKFTLGANTCTVVITLHGATTSTAPNGWSCHASDRTAPLILISQSADSATTASLSIPATAGATDVISFSCIGY